MKCCEKCFMHGVIKDTIRSLSNKAYCDFCGSQNVFVYDISNDSGLDVKFSGIFNVFRKRDELPEDYPSGKLFLIKDVFANQYNVFSDVFPKERVVDFLEELLKSNFPDKVDLLRETVGVSEYTSSSFLNSSSLLKEFTWEEFITYIRCNNRFHSRHINFDVFKEYIEGLTRTIKENSIFYRARISNNEELIKEKMYAPPADLARAGRANSEGISHLYLAKDIETVIKEIRPKTKDKIYIGNFRLKHDIKVVDFRKLKTISIFDFEDNPAKYIVNYDNFRKLSEEISKPIKTGDSILDYLPTQFFVDLIKSINDFDMREEDIRFSGIEFKSTLSTTGHNLMVFSENCFECIEISKTEINAVSYNHEVQPLED